LCDSDFTESGALQIYIPNENTNRMIQLTSSSKVMSPYSGSKPSKQTQI